MVVIIFNTTSVMSIILPHFQMAIIRKGNWLPWKTPVEGVGAEGHVFVANGAGEVLSLCRFEPGRICPKYFLGGDD